MDSVYLDSARLSKASPITPSLTKDKWKVRLIGNRLHRWALRLWSAAPSPSGVL